VYATCDFVGDYDTDDIVAFVPKLVVKLVVTLSVKLIVKLIVTLAVSSSSYSEVTIPKK
jgi:hypothetical protein